MIILMSLVTSVLMVAGVLVLSCILEAVVKSVRVMYSTKEENPFL